MAAGPIVSAFYYPWFATNVEDGSYAHWAQDGHLPPNDISSVYYPALGVYSSDDPGVLDAQMAEIQRAGINQIAVSWWGKGSPEDQRLPGVIAGGDGPPHRRRRPHRAVHGALGRKRRRRHRLSRHPRRADVLHLPGIPDRAG